MSFQIRDSQQCGYRLVDGAYLGVKFSVELDGIRVNGKALPASHPRPEDWKIIWRLRFDNPLVRRHPNYPEIRRLVISNLKLWS